MNERFSYRGSATIGGLLLPNVELRENASDGGLRSWEGSASFPVSDAPEGFPRNFETGGPLPVELADGRRGEIFVQGVGFDGSRWNVDLLGTGPAPGTVEGRQP